MLLQWLGHAASLLFWLGAAFLLFVELIFGRGVTPLPTSYSPDGRYVLTSSHSDPGAMATVRQSFALRSGVRGPFESFIDLHATPSVEAIQHRWTPTTVTLSGVPVASLRSIIRSGHPSAQMILRFQEAE